jgi:hypothetical protein
MPRRTGIVVATTDPGISREVLRGLDRIGVRWAVLHNVEGLMGRAAISDTDVVISEEPWGVLDRLADREELSHLRLVMTWQYDRGAVTSFWVTRDGMSGAQIDLLFDPHGRGRYGFRTAVALTDVEETTWPPRLGDTARLVYSLSKRIVKGDDVGARHASDELLRHDHHAEETARMLRGSQRRLALRARAGTLRPAKPRRVQWLKLRHRLNRRALERLVYPTGVVLAVEDAKERAALATALQQVVIRVIARDHTTLVRSVADWFSIRRPVVIVTGSRGAGKRLPLRDAIDQVHDVVRARIRARI